MNIKEEYAANHRSKSVCLCVCVCVQTESVRTAAVVFGAMSAQLWEHWTTSVNKEQ